MQARNITNILLGILTAAVAGLYILYFTGQQDEPTALPVPKSGPREIVYVNSDSLREGFNYYQAEYKKLEGKQKFFKADLEKKAADLKKDFNTYMAKGANMSDNERARTEEELKTREQDIYMLEQKYSNQMVEFEDQLVKDSNAKISEYLKKISKKAAYNYVLGYSTGGGILYANENLEVTKSLVEGLNTEYPVAE
jgi:outer membrane protein